MPNNQAKASRRGFFLSASAVGAAVATTAWLKTPAPAAVTPPARPAPEKGGGYSLSEHVKQYYQTTRV
ncbi:MAG: formate dehydrogenase [Comamonadaceae bacterium]